MSIAFPVSRGGHISSNNSLKHPIAHPLRVGVGVWMSLVGSSLMGLCRFSIYNISLYWATVTVTSNDRHGVSNYRSIQCLFNTLFRLTTKKYQRSALLSLCEGNPPVSCGSHHKRPITRKLFPFDDVITFPCYRGLRYVCRKLWFVRVRAKYITFTHIMDKTI